jgi:hypothetical protein
VSARDKIIDKEANNSLMRFLCTMLLYFVGIAFVSLALTFIVSATACLWNPHVACFSFAHHGIWLLVAFVAALTAAGAAQSLGSPKWWYDIGLVCIAIISAGLLAWHRNGKISIAHNALLEPFSFAFELVVLLLAFSICGPAARRICRARS